MNKRIFFILFLTLIFPFGKDFSAQATCEGTIQVSALGAWGSGTQVGDGTPGDIKVCITANTLAAVGMGCSAVQVVLSTADGSGIDVIWDDGTANSTCWTFTTGTGFAWLSFNSITCLVAGTDATLTWETVDGADVNQCAAPTCSDLIMNQDETGIDCGGASCPACGAPTCSDLVQNQDETGIDCGGVCPACAVATDGCTDAPLVAADSTCTTGTTVGASDSWSGTPGCQSGDGHPDVWFEFTATGSNSEITVENGTMTGDIEIILVEPNCGSDNCTCPFVLIGSSCGASPNTGTFNTVAGQNYYYTISSSTGSQGTFTSCVESNDDVAPGQDCNTAQALCVDGGFSVGNLQNGTGAVLESTWMSCASEQNSQWYTFTATADGSFSAMVSPDTWTSPTTGDDYDFSMFDITTSGCTSSATELACDFSGCAGSTGFSATGAAGFGQVTVTDFRGDNPAGPADCTEGSAGSQWNTNAVNLVAGNTYAYMIQNYTGSTGGATVTFGGTTSLAMDATFTGTLAGNCYDYSVVLNSAYTGANWTYAWDFGDGTGTSTLAEPAYTYTVDGSYTVSFTMTSSVGCVAAGSASVTAGCPVPITLNHFSAECIGEEAKLSWSTASEENNAGFTLQRSEDGNTFKNIGEIEGAGKSTSLIKYDYVDKKPLRKGSYYRLRQDDFDGKSSYSQIIRVENCGDYGITVSPNPSKGEFYLTFDSAKEGNYEITVFDIRGKKVTTQNIKVENNSNKIHTLDLTKLDKGIYLMNISDDSGSINLKIVTE